MPITCQKCRHIRSAQDDPLIPDYQCPACGVVYAKIQRNPLSGDVMKNIKRSRKRPENLRPAVFVADEKPHDDIRNTQPAPTNLTTLDPKILGVVSILIFGGFMLSEVIKGYEKQAAAEKLEAERKAAQIRASDERRWANDAKAAREREESKRIQQEKARIRADETRAQCAVDARCTFLGLQNMPQIDCQKMVEKQSKWTFKWTDGVFESKFDRFLWADAAHSAIYAAGDHIQFQNGFGAMADMQYVCEVDAKTGVIKNVTVKQGRF